MKARNTAAKALAARKPTDAALDTGSTLEITTDSLQSALDLAADSLQSALDLAANASNATDTPNPTNASDSADATDPANPPNSIYSPGATNALELAGRSGSHKPQLRITNCGHRRTRPKR
ncbi:MAG TPA: hypothetical protein VKS79_19770 [Gemmataceae bacterium]|nr:hypothetical protein [Gemmataceae bacterium]